MTGVHAPERIVIMGAAGRDFHNFNVVFRDDPATRVVAFTAAQIPGIDERRYPPGLAGARYPDGIPIVPEAELEALCRRLSVDRVVFAYSDVSHATVMHAAARAHSAGADFVLLGPDRTMLAADLPVLAVSAVRTGCGKSQTGRWLSQHLRARGLRVAVVRHPMPYGDLERQRAQRFASLADLAAADCTVEEREEYEPHIAIGNVVYAGVDYADILAQAQREADLILWEGGNNDFPFYRPDLHIALVDALRPDQVDTHHPGETVMRLADIVVISKSDAAPAASIARLREAVARLNPDAPIVLGASPVSLDDRNAVIGRRVLIIEDGPSVTHGGMPHGAGYAAVFGLPNTVIVDPRRLSQPDFAATYAAYPHIGPVVPALGYDEHQRAAMAALIAESDADVVVAATPIDLAGLLHTDRPVVRARYDYADAGDPTLTDLVDRFLDKAPG